MQLEYTYSNLPSEFYSDQPVYKYPNAKIAMLNKDLADDLGMILEQDDSQLLAQLLGYNSKKPISQAYAGHQFGNFTILGDGRAILIGEHKTNDGSLVDIHLKGAGLTKYSRGGDGKATLDAMLREYIVSESMDSLGIPTSRILAVITTGENIQRQDGLKQGAIAIRVASSHIRVGTFQYAAIQGKEHTQQLLDYTIDRHNIPYQGNKALALLKYVIDKQTSLIVNWERVGFIHGVMNTDNMTISGETIDYGPCAFMDNYHPDTVFSYIDSQGRYAFNNQAQIAGWNIARLAESLLELISDNQDEAIELAQQQLSYFSKTYTNKWQKMFAQKLGYDTIPTGFSELASSLLAQMQTNNLDYTNTFSSLGLKSKLESNIQELFDKYKDILSDRNLDLMSSTNPAIIPRNHNVEKAIKLAENSNMLYLENLILAMKNCYEHDDKYSEFMQEANDNEIVEFTFCGT